MNRLSSASMGKKKAPPPGLKKRDSALAKGKRARIVEQAHEDIGLVKEKQNEIAAAFYEMGLALQRLSKKTVYAALGHKSFDDLLRARVGMSRAQADHLMLIVRHIDEADAIRWKQDKSYAVAALKELPGTMALGRTRLQLPSREVIDIEHTPTAELTEKAETERHRHQKKSGPRPRGRTTTPEERKQANELKRALAHIGIRAKVECIATKPGKSSDVALRFACTAIDDLVARL